MGNSMLQMIENGYTYGFVGFSTFFRALFCPTALPYTIIMILLLAGLCMAAWKAPRWVRPVGRMTMIVVAFNLIVGIMQICDCYQRLGGREHDWNNGYIGFCMKPIVCVALIGVIIYLISLFISIAQKPRI